MNRFYITRSHQFEERDSAKRVLLYGYLEAHFRRGAPRDFLRLDF